MKLGADVSNSADKRTALRASIERGELIVAPGVFDLISVRIAERQGHAALYMTGYGTVASYLGLPDAGLASFTDMCDRARTMAQASTAPLIADADTGYGGLLNVQHTVRGYEAAGVAAIQLEDQAFPKKCGHTPGRRVIAEPDMVKKVQVACATRSDPNLLIIARTDARTAHGLDEAITRARAYREAGADVLFVEAPENADEFARIATEVEAPLVANMVDGGRSPVLSAATLRELGYRIAIYPAVGFTAAAAAVEAAYGHLHETGSTLELETPLYSVDKMHELMGFEAVWDFEKKWGE